MKKLIVKLLSVFLVLVLCLSFIGCKKKNKKDNPDSGGEVPGGQVNEQKVPSKQASEIDNIMGVNYELILKYSGSDSSSELDLGEYTCEIKKANDYVFYTEYPTSDRNDVTKYLLNDDKLYLYVANEDKYRLVPTNSLNDPLSYLVGYSFIYTYSTLKDYPYNTKKSVIVNGFNCNQYEYDGIFQGSQMNYKVAFDVNTGLCLLFESNAVTDYGTFISKYQVSKFEKGKVNIDSEIAKISNDNEDSKKFTYTGKTKEEIDTALTSNVKIDISLKEDSNVGHLIFTKDAGYKAFDFENDGGYNDIILVKDDYYLGRTKNSKYYGYASSYDENHLSTDVSDIELALNILVQKSYNIEYQTKEDVKYINRDCTKLLYEAPRPYAYSPYVILEYTIDNQTGLCLYYKEQRGSSLDDLDVMEVKVNSIEFGSASLDSEIDMILCDKWLGSTLFSNAGMNEVSAPNGSFYSTDIQKSLSGKTTVYVITYIINDPDEMINMCNSFYNAGINLNEEEQSVSIDELFDSEEKTYFTAYNKTGVNVSIQLDDTYNNKYYLEISFSITTDFVHEHSWGEVSYVWSDDYKECTATRVCTKDSTHIQTEKVATTFFVTQNQSCEKDELSRIQAVFTTSGLGYDIKNDVITKQATGHVFDQTVAKNSYLKDHATCTSKAIYYKSCKCGLKGDETFEHGEILGHSYDEVVWNWSIDNTQCTVKFICSRDSNHIEEKVATVQSSTILSTCLDKGMITYIARYIKGDELLEDVKEVILPIDESKHEWEKIDAITPTCYDPGCEEGRYCLICYKEELGEEIPSLGHDFGDEVYPYDDYQHVKYCTRDCGECENEDHIHDDHFEFDQFEHYHICTLCNAMYDREWHNYDDNHQCSCGALSPEYCTHSYTQEYTDYNGHYKKCSNCGVFDYDTLTPHIFDQEAIKQEFLVQEASCEHPAIYAKSCRCGVASTSKDDFFEVGETREHSFYGFEYISNNQHKAYCYFCDYSTILDCMFDDTFDKDENTHFHSCVDCQHIKDVENHSYVDGKCICGVIHPDLCEHDYCIEDHNQQSHYLRCIYCYQIDESSICDHDFYTTDRCDPTCYLEGHEEGRACNFCDYFEEGKKIDKLPHDFTGDSYKYDDLQHVCYCEFGCGEELYEDHQSDEYEYNDYEHYYVCDICHEEYGHENHQYDSDGKCICGASEYYY